MTKVKAATIKERNALFAILQNQIKRGQNVLIRAGHTFERAAREFDAEGLVKIEDANRIDGSYFFVTRTF
jgi:hypothetical protein